MKRQPPVRWILESGDPSVFYELESAFRLVANQLEFDGIEGPHRFPGCSFNMDGWMGVRTGRYITIVRQE